MSQLHKMIDKEFIEFLESKYFSTFFRNFDQYEQIEQTTVIAQLCVCYKIDYDIMYPLLIKKLETLNKLHCSTQTIPLLEEPCLSVTSIELQQCHHSSSFINNDFSSDDEERVLATYDFNLIWEDYPLFPEESNSNLHDLLTANFV